MHYQCDLQRGCTNFYYLRSFKSSGLSLQASCRGSPVPILSACAVQAQLEIPSIWLRTKASLNPRFFVQLWSHSLLSAPKVLSSSLSHKFPVAVCQPHSPTLMWQIFVKPRIVAAEKPLEWIIKSKPEPIGFLCFWLEVCSFMIVFTKHYWIRNKFQISHTPIPHLLPNSTRKQNLITWGRIY